MEIPSWALSGLLVVMVFWLAYFIRGAFTALGVMLDSLSETAETLFSRELSVVRLVSLGATLLFCGFPHAQGMATGDFNQMVTPISPSVFPMRISL
jgi:hypothetical protein